MLAFLDAKGSWIQFQNVCVCVQASPCQQGISWRPAECPGIWLNSDIIYPEKESDSTAKGLHPTMLPSISNTRCKPRFLPVFLTH